MHTLEAIALCYQRGTYGVPCATCDQGDATKPHDIVMRCACRSWACGKDKHIWTATPDGPNTVALSPSVDWAGHFHAYFAGVLVQSMAALHFLPEGA